MYRRSIPLTVKNNDNWTFLIFFVFTIVFPLELETRLYYLSITITTDVLPPQMGCSKENKFCSKRQFMNFKIRLLFAFAKRH